MPIITHRETKHRESITLPKTYMGPIPVAILAHDSSGNSFPSCALCGHGHAATEIFVSQWRHGEPRTFHLLTEFGICELCTNLPSDELKDAFLKLAKRLVKEAHPAAIEYLRSKPSAFDLIDNPVQDSYATIANLMSLFDRGREIVYERELISLHYGCR